ncbi:MAG: hypothetical protein WDZ37_06440 [Solirubrobacterales bacterium]
METLCTGRSGVRTGERLANCRYCGGRFVQPRSWRELRDGRMRLTLRCPECAALTLGVFAAEQVERYDRELVHGRRALVRAYERMLRDNMAAEAETLRRALEMELVGADDFATSRTR